MDKFRVRLNNVDHYQSPPSDFDPPLFGHHGSTQRIDAPQLPVIRVFGATETGQKVCAHIHGALPYLYIEYKGSLEDTAVSAYIEQLRASVDHALAVSYRRNTYDGKAVYVAHITLVKGIPFFGYHVGYRFFMKIYMLNPLHMTRFADLLYQGAIMAQVLQPFESHLQYLLQWMCDFNLYGCTYIDCKRVKFRGPVPEHDEIGKPKDKWHTGSVSQDMMSDPVKYPRQSHCSLEVDVRVQDILNRDEIELRNLHSTFVERFSPLTPDEKLVHSLAGLWRDETRRRKLRMGLTDPSSSPFPPEVLISMSADPRHNDKGGWIHEEEFRELVHEIVQEEQRSFTNDNMTFEDFIKPTQLQNTVQTVLESVEDLFTERLLSQSTEYIDAAISDNGNHKDLAQTAVVDESSIPKFDDDDFPYESDEEKAREKALTQRVSSGVACDNDNLEVKHASHVQSWQNSSGEIEKSFLPVQEGFPVGMKDVSEEFVDVSGHARHSNEVLNRSKLAHGLEEADTHGNPKRMRYSNNGLEDCKTNAINGEMNERQSAKSASQCSRNSKDGKEALTPISSQQLSQRSIKARGSTSNPRSSFPVVKNAFSNSNPDISKLENVTSSTYTSPRIGNADNSVSTPLSKNSAKLTTSTSPLSCSNSTPKAELSPQILRLVAQPSNHSQIIDGHHVFYYGVSPPTRTDINTTLPDSGIPSMLYQDVYYSNEKDVPDRSRDYAGREFKLESNSTPYLPAFDPTALSVANFGAKPALLIDFAKQEALFQRKRDRCHLQNWEFVETPPTRQEVEEWHRKESSDASTTQEDDHHDVGTEQLNPENTKQGDLSQIDGPTQRNKHGFKYTQKQNSTSVRHETQYMSTMSLEVHVNTRDNLVPNPEEDNIACVFWCFKSDNDDVVNDKTAHGSRVGIVVFCDGEEDLSRKLTKESHVSVDGETSELDLINRMVDIVRDFDPDILTGYEVHNSSWGYLIERARIKYEYDLCDEFSRMKSQSHGRFGKDADRWGFNHTSTIRVTGRHMINIWRAMRSELNLLQYTMENVAFHVLHKRIPHYAFKNLTRWYKSKIPRDLAKVIHYFLSRVQLDIEILEANELIARTSEQARLIGVDFFSVFSRGSQFKVESFMFRIAKPENFLLVSPSRKQVGQQNALECLPLVMEPQSAFYNSPLLVLDFQSLYPSIMIAYNYCYSTCLGRIVNWRGQNKMGFADFKRQPRLLELVKDHINIAPNGIMYVKPEMRKSLLAKMLGEILETRVMVKSGMKVDKQDKTLQQLLNNRQLALKLLANVTYGYTSASFSGRMPCSEIADSIVQTGRETLEKAIALIHSVERWGAEVVYGDTDSLFVYLKGRTKDQAFEIGNEIAKAITDRNPRPVKLKFEKVYFPCVLLAKKRYVGFKYESPSQVEPEFDAKGIETVRRDGTPAEQKIEEKALKLLFRTADLSQIKDYFQRQCAKVMLGQVSIQDFCFAKEVKLGTYSDKGPPPPGALISTRRMLEDPRLEPQYGERVPYVVITGAPGARLIDRCVAPEQLLKDESAELDAEYYISKNLIPPLERIFNLVGANVRQWFDEMPKVQRIRDLIDNAPQQTSNAMPIYAPNGALVPPKKTLENYMKSSHCIVCRTKLPPCPAVPNNQGQVVVDNSKNSIDTPLPLCVICNDDAARSLHILRTRLHNAQRKSVQLETVCRNCSGLSWAEEVSCDSKDCPVFYSRVKGRSKERRMRGILDVVGNALEKDSDSVDW